MLLSEFSDLYCSVSYNLPSSIVFIRKRIRLITKLTDGVICERWLGNVTTADGEKKSALITHLKGVICFEHFSWDWFVKRFLEKMRIFSRFKECALMNVTHLYLLQDYMPCESFVEHLCVKTNREETRKDMTTDFLVKKLTNLSLQVCYGMEFAMAYGLSHPGLSVKKILINEECVCKLYDFCLAEDASKIVKCLKSEADFMPSSHPPECVARNEYTCASDVWYTAFTVREIYSYGKLLALLTLCFTVTFTGGRQFPCLSNLNRKESLMYSLQPELCSSILYERVKTCLTPNHDERPKNVKGLLMDLKAEVNSVSAEDSPTQNEEINARKYSSYLPTTTAMDKKLYSTHVKLEKIAIES
ncbi:Proto-oncogene tyrosine-protein kinase LCK [Holothuria leucospilota]|uniref:Proto-oncogene tyrosine-protein kinase LCK n=1 Tax=Holothuria leucospilota TaxID=206669 RepID=A0A9Q1HMC0_HOLLE|nr:Proto-oncogene tyrosine-protein kinase LCK [Holothuria leucospilota]